MHIIRVILFYLSVAVVSVGSLYAEAKVHLYDIEKGMVQYEILGGAHLTNETNLNIQGTATLRFKKWGDVKIEEDKGIVSTSGAIHSVQQIKRLEKYTENSVITVDFENEQLLERKKGKIVSSYEKETKGLTHKGQEVVAGYTCEVWVGPSIKKCIYKGIVLKQESIVLGVSYAKVAKEAIFDINISEDKCLVPNYPVHAFSLYKNRFKTKNVTTPTDVCSVFKDVENEVDEKNRTYTASVNMGDKRRKKFVNKIAEGIFQTQKRVLPEILMAMKKNRECLHLSEDLFDLQRCVEVFESKKKELGILDNDYHVFDGAQTKEKMLDKIEDAIISLQPRIPCVNRAENITDLSHCMK